MSAFDNMKLSIVVPVLNSHAVVRRQILHYKSMDLPDDIEIIFIDDGSDPALKSINTRGLENFYIYPSGDTRPWTIACARNLGIKIAQGEYIFNTDIDHILPKTTIMAAYIFDGDKLEFSREYGVLDNKGNLVQECDYLFKYGLSKNRYKKHGVNRYRHVGTHVIKKKIVKEIGGYPKRCCETGTYPTKEDRFFYQRYLRHCKAGKCHASIMMDELKVYCWPSPNDKFKTFFHQLERDSH